MMALPNIWLFLLCETKVRPHNEIKGWYVLRMRGQG
ncbi:hypothetical protein MCEMRE203_01242 [Candidatus Nanopelagicaceae bacterium]